MLRVPGLGTPTMAVGRGRDARLDGRPITDCPYALGSLESLSWFESWIEEDVEISEATLSLIRMRGRGK